MSDIRYSLCIAELDYNSNETRNKAWRVADYDIEDECFVEAIYNETEDTTINNHNPQYIRAFVNTLTPYVPEIRSWTVITSINGNTDETYLNTESNPLHKHPIEILYLSQIDLEVHNSDTFIRDLLQQGIMIPKNISENFFIISNKSSDLYEALFFNKKQFRVNSDSVYKIEKHCSDMLRATHSVGLHFIRHDEIFTTEHCAMYVEQGKRAEARYFYKFLKENRYDRKFFLRNPEDYAKAYISKYIKNNKEVLKISKSEAQKWSNMIDEALTNKVEIELFFKETGFRVSDVEYALKDLSQEIRELYLQDSEFSRIVERCLLKDTLVLEHCKEEVKKIWMLEQDDMKESILKEISTIQIELSKLENEKGLLISEIDTYSKKNKKIKETYNELQETEKNLIDKRSSIEKDIDNTLKHFQQDIVGLAAMSALGSAKNSKDSETFLPYMHQNDLSKKVTESSIRDISELVDDMQDNLIAFGAKTEYSYDLAVYIATSIILRKNIIVCGNKTIEIANSVSLILEKQCAKEIYLPLGFTDISMLISLINQTNNLVFTIYGALDSFSDNVFLSISKFCKGKIIFFACEDIDTYQPFPSYWVSYASYIYPNSIWDYATDDELHSSLFNVFEREINLDSNSIDFLNDLVKEVKIKQLQHNEINKFIKCYSALVNTDVVLNYPICCYLTSIFSKQKDLVCDFFATHKVSDTIIDLVKDELCYE